MSISNNSFKKYVSENISPTERERNMISQRYKDLSGIVKGNNFQSGSYARFTSITLVNDLDVIWELPEDTLVKTNLREKIIQKTIDPVDLDISNVLSELANKLRDEYKKRNISVLKIEAQTHSVGIYFGPLEDDFSIDIVPAVPEGSNEFGDSMYLVPEIIKYHKDMRLKMYYDKTPIDWIKSDPRGYIKEATALNDANENYRHAVKFCKKWKWHLKDNRPNLKFKSFHIEMIIKDLIYKTPSIDSLGAVKEFLGNLSSYLEQPKILDRANNGKFIDGYLTELSQENKNMIINEASKSMLILNGLDENSNVDKELYDLLNNNTRQSQTHSANRSVNPISRPYAEIYENNTQ